MLNTLITGFAAAFLVLLVLVLWQVIKVGLKAAYRWLLRGDKQLRWLVTGAAVSLTTMLLALGWSIIPSWGLLTVSVAGGLLAVWLVARERPLYSLLFAKMTTKSWHWFFVMGQITGGVVFILAVTIGWQTGQPWEEFVAFVLLALIIVGYHERWMVLTGRAVAAIAFLALAASHLLERNDLSIELIVLLGMGLAVLTLGYWTGFKKNTRTALMLCALVASWVTPALRLGWSWYVLVIALFGLIWGARGVEYQKGTKWVFGALGIAWAKVFTALVEEQSWAADVEFLVDSMAALLFGGAVYAFWQFLREKAESRRALA